MNQEKQNQPQRRDRYEERFCIFSDWVENKLLKILVVLFLILLCAQWLLQFDSVREVLTSIDSMEGTPEFETYF